MTIKLLKPHAVEPLRVIGDHLAPFNGGIHVSDYLAETSPASPSWCASLVRRLIGVSTGPVAVEVKEPGARYRLEQAGWFVAAQDVDVQEARHSCWPALPTLRRLAAGYGCPRPALVLVTERVYRPDQLPLASLHGAHLFKALRLLGYDELTLYVTTAADHNRKRRPKRLRALADLFAGNGATWVPLGRQAEKALSQAGIDAAGYVPAPQHMLRMNPGAGVEGYAKRLNAAGVSHGPYHAVGKAPVGPRVDALPVLPAPYDLMDVSTRRGKGAGETRVRGEVNNPAAVQAARRDYVLGNAPTIDEAARMHGMPGSTLGPVASAEGWVAEREHHHRSLTEKAKEQAMRAEVKAMSSCRKLAWVSNQLALSRYVAFVRDTPEHVPTPRQIECLTRVALQLSGAGVGATDEERDAISRMPLVELAQQTIRQIEKGLGGA